MNRISVIMATLNGERYVRDQILSIINQSLKPDEIIVSDDGSIDNTLQIIHEVSLDSPVPIFTCRNEVRHGYGFNFQNAFLRCAGDMIFFCDQDDIWYQNKLRTMLDIAYQNPSYTVFTHDCELVDAERNRSGLTKLSQLRSIGLPETSLTMGCCTVAKRSILEICFPLPTTQLAHDDWICKISDVLGQRLVVPNVLQQYRIHDKNTSRNVANSLKRRARAHRLFSALSRLWNVEDRIIRLDNSVNFLTEVLSRVALHSSCVPVSVSHFECLGELKARRQNVDHRFRRLKVLQAVLSGGYRRSGFIEFILDLV